MGEYIRINTYVRTQITIQSSKNSRPGVTVTGCGPVVGGPVPRKYLEWPIMYVALATNGLQGGEILSELSVVSPAEQNERTVTHAEPARDSYVAISIVHALTAPACWYEHIVQL